MLSSERGPTVWPRWAVLILAAAWLILVDLLYYWTLVSDYGARFADSLGVSSTP